ncbi:hypothetical protein ACQW02_00385 [Humitalea sp. 24SJ18S-53]|uniref:hypothetical protein n=1 Tax=Humitalea sp. 24SJ18S-53 TaxID=3422307 RepID=UPI003D675596
MPLDVLIRAVWAMRGRLLLICVVLYGAAAGLVLSWPRAYLASAVVAPAEGSGLAVSTLIAPINLQSGSGLLDTRPTGNFAIYLAALRSPEAAAMLAATTPILADMSARRATGALGWIRGLTGMRMTADQDDVQAYLERRLSVTQSLVATTWNLELPHGDRAMALDLLTRLLAFGEAHVRADLSAMAERRLAALEARAATERDVFQRTPLYELLAQHQRALAVLRSDEAVAARLVSLPMAELRASVPNRMLILVLLFIAVPVAVLVGAGCLVLLRTPDGPPGDGHRGAAPAP